MENALQRFRRTGNCTDGRKAVCSQRGKKRRHHHLIQGKSKKENKREAGKLEALFLVCRDCESPRGGFEKGALPVLRDGLIAGSDARGRSSPQANAILVKRGGNLSGRSQL